jgi:hypothetical protein
VGREDLIWIGLVLVLLIVGLLLGQRLLGTQSNDGGPREAMAFRQWLWESRSLDLAVQVGLILTGALAIAALLPREGEANGETLPDWVPPGRMPPDSTQDESR